jgi:hypothetical protein
MSRRRRRRRRRGGGGGGGGGGSEAELGKEVDRRGEDHLGRIYCARCYSVWKKG